MRISDWSSDVCSSDFRRLGIGEEQFRAMLDDAIIFLRRAGQEAGDVDEGDDRNLERVAETDEARRLLGRIDVEHAREHQRLVRDDADRAALDAPETAEDRKSKSLNSRH